MDVIWLINQNANRLKSIDLLGESMIETQPLVSMIITTHNRSDVMLNAIYSALDQKYDNKEVIVVNDASVDDTDQILRSLEDQGAIQYICIGKEETRGGNYARNKGIKAAKGKYVAFCDDDDRWLPEKTIKQVRLLEEHPNCGMVYCGRYRDRNGALSKDKIRIIEGNLSEGVFEMIVGTTTTMIFRREVLKQVGLFDEKLRYWQETELVIRIAAVSDILVVPELLCVYRDDTNEKGRLSNHYEEWLDAVEYINQKHKERIEKLPNRIKKRWRCVFLKDAAVRAAGKSRARQRRRYLFEIWKLTNNPKWLIKAALNIADVGGSIDRWMKR